MNEKSGRTSTSSNVKTGQAKIHRVVIEAWDQPGTNLWGARSDQDIPELREPDHTVYLEADRICEIARKQAMREELNSLSVVNESVDNPITSDSAAMADVADVPLRATSINKIDILSEDAALTTADAMCDGGTKHVTSSEPDTKSPLQLLKLHYCDVLMKITDEKVKSIHCLEDSGAEISIIQKDTYIHTSPFIVS